MSDRTSRPTRPSDAASIIAYATREQGITIHALANLLEIRPEVIEAILEHEIPVPLMLVPKIADALETDAAPLMTQALGELQCVLPRVCDKATEISPARKCDLIAFNIP